jgi:hypothetical protein
MIWIAWPKRSSGVPTDLDENGIRELALPLGVVDVKVCAIDETWPASSRSAERATAEDQSCPTGLIQSVTFPTLLHDVDHHHPRVDSCIQWATTLSGAAWRPCGYCRKPTSARRPGALPGSGKTGRRW